jgi:hypothetical protein
MGRLRSDYDYEHSKDAFLILILNLNRNLRLLASWEAAESARVPAQAPRLTYFHEGILITWKRFVLEPGSATPEGSLSGGGIHRVPFCRQSVRLSVNTGDFARFCRQNCRQQASTQASEASGEGVG